MTTEIASATVVDYKKFYDVETYLLNEVGPLFRQTGELDPESPLMWKRTVPAIWSLSPIRGRRR